MKVVKHVHFTGICGKATAPIAKMFKDMGWKVTGTDASSGGWGPVAEFLKECELPCILGYSEENLTSLDTKPDLLIQGGSAWTKWPNPEIEWAKENDVEVISFPEALRDHLIKRKSIVVTGTYGKTTISSLMAWILEVAEEDPSFMIGSVPLNFGTGVRNTDSDISVVEGDEHPTLKYKDEKPKFMYYVPTHVILTATKWDHINVFETEDDYIEAFRELAKKLADKNGTFLMSANGENNEEVKKAYKGKAYTYMMKEKEKEKRVHGGVDFTGEVVAHFEDRTVFRVYEGTDLLWEFETPLIGEYNVENCVAAIGMSRLMGVDLKPIVKAMRTFKGIRRRQEIIGTNSKGAIIMDDFAHSPVKARATLEGLRKRYKDHQIIGVFSAHASSLAKKESLKWYPGVFDKADYIIVPKVKVRKSTPKDERVYGKDIVEAISKTQSNVEYIPVDDNIVAKIHDLSDEKTLVVFMSSGGWDGLIEKCLN